MKIVRKQREEQLLEEEEAAKMEDKQSGGQFLPQTSKQPTKTPKWFMLVASFPLPFPFSLFVCLSFAAKEPEP